MAESFYKDENLPSNATEIAKQISKVICIEVSRQGELQEIDFHSLVTEVERAICKLKSDKRS